PIAAIGASAWAMCTAPTMNMRRGGLKAWTKTGPASVSIVWLLSSRCARRAAARRVSVSARSPSALSPSMKAWRPSLSAVATTTARFAARADWRASKTNRFISNPAQSFCLLRSGPFSIQLFHEHLHLAAAGQAHFPRLLVGDAEIEQTRFAVGDDFLRLEHDGALDAAAGDRAFHLLLVADHQLAADRARRGAPRGDDGCDRDAFARVPPGAGGCEHVVRAQ